MTQNVDIFLNDQYLDEAFAFNLKTHIMGTFCAWDYPLELIDIWTDGYKFLMQNCAPILDTKYLKFIKQTLLDRPHCSDKICIFGMTFEAIISFELFSSNSLYVGFSRGAYTARWLVQPFSSVPFVLISATLKLSPP